LIDVMLSKRGAPSRASTCPRRQHAPRLRRPLSQKP
jgi:hypothetical protein